MSAFIPSHFHQAHRSCLAARPEYTNIGSAGHRLSSMVVTSQMVRLTSLCWLRSNSRTSRPSALKISSVAWSVVFASGNCTTMVVWSLKGLGKALIDSFSFAQTGRNRALVASAFRLSISFTEYLFTIEKATLSIRPQYLYMGV